jgi:hypothetical protein
MMPLWNILRSLIGVLLMCFAVEAMGQSVTNSVTSAVDASSASSAEATVSASVDLSPAEVNIPSHNKADLGLSGKTATSLGKPVAAEVLTYQRNTFKNGSAKPSETQMFPYKGVREQPGMNGKSSLLATSRLRFRSNTSSGIATPAAFLTPNSALPKAPVTFSFQESPSYSPGFADSTRGTTLISPPDPGASSPLQWEPDLNFGFSDLTQHTFLDPSLTSTTRPKRRKSREQSTLLSGQSPPAVDHPVQSAIPDELEQSPEEQLGQPPNGQVSQPSSPQ